MSTGQLRAEIAKRDNWIKILTEKTDANNSLIEMLKTEYQSLRESSEAKIKQSDEDFIKCYKERTALKKANETLRSELFHLKEDFHKMEANRNSCSIRANSLASDFYDLEQTRTGRIALWVQKRKTRKQNGR